MARLPWAMIASVTATAAFAAVAATLASPASDGLLAQHWLIAEGSLVLAMVSAVALGTAIGRSATGDAGQSMAATPGPSPVAPLTARAGAETMTAETMTRAEIEFLANMGHELRTPLNVVLGFAELILSEIHGPMSDQRYCSYVSHIRTGGEQLLAIADAILDLYQLAAGQLELQPRHVEPRAIVEECAQSVAAQAEAAKVELVVRPSTAPPVAADPDRLKQVLTNLLSNAVKFSPEGGRVSIGATFHDDTVAFEVTDTGIGMTPEQVDVALQPFRMIDNRMSRRHSGMGLGLPLAERLVRLHGGELRIDSRPGSGTSVTAILPRSASRQHDKGGAP